MTEQMTLDVCNQAKPETPSSRDDGYLTLVSQVAATFEKKTKSKKVFTTSADGSAIWKAFIDNLPEQSRKHYQCNSCRRFVEQYGGLAVINSEEAVTSAVWPASSVPRFFAKSVADMLEIVSSSQINGVFATDLTTLGNPYDDVEIPGYGEAKWVHFHASSAHLKNGNALLTADQVMAAKLEDHKMVTNAIAKYSVNTVDKARAMAAGGSLYRGEKVLANIEWFANLVKKYNGRRGTNRDAKRRQDIWAAIIDAPVGFCNISSGIIGSLFDDIASGMSDNLIRKSFAEKMDPLKYRRPQAAPAAGNIIQANRIVDKLGVEPSFDRRFATINDIQEKLWVPSNVRGNLRDAAAAGMFSGVTPKRKGKAPGACIPNTSSGTQTMTWAKFNRVILAQRPSRIQYKVAGTAAYMALTTANIPSSKPIFQWDNETARNPVSWYFRGTGGSNCYNWGLTQGSYTDVKCICKFPHQWNGVNLPNLGEGAIFVLHGANDAHYSSSLAIFPEMLKSEFHSIRSTVESFSNSKKIRSVQEPACGIGIRSSHSSLNVELRVTIGNSVLDVVIDRFE